MKTSLLLDQNWPPGQRQWRSWQNWRRLTTRGQEGAVHRGRILRKITFVHLFGKKQVLKIFLADSIPVTSTAPKKNIK
jgi:hypothetical protein